MGGVGAGAEDGVVLGAQGGERARRDGQRVEEPLQQDARRVVAREQERLYLVGCLLQHGGRQGGRVA